MGERIGNLLVGKGLLGALIEHPTPIRISDITRQPRSCSLPPITSFLCEQDVARVRGLRRPAWATHRPSEDDLGHASTGPWPLPAVHERDQPWGMTTTSERDVLAIRLWSRR